MEPPKGGRSKEEKGEKGEKEKEKKNPPRVEYEKTCKKCKGASSTVVFELASNDYLRFLVGSSSSEVGYVAFVRDFSGHPMDEVVVMDEWWGSCSEGRCIRSEKPRMNLKRQGPESNFPPLLRIGFNGSG